MEQRVSIKNQVKNAGNFAEQMAEMNMMAYTPRETFEIDKMGVKPKPKADEVWETTGFAGPSSSSPHKDKTASKKTVEKKAGDNEFFSDFGTESDRLARVSLSPSLSPSLSDPTRYFPKYISIYQCI